jgi:hypothetical protein
MAPLRMTDPDIWRLAARLIKTYEEGAEMAAAMYAEKALAKNDFRTSAKWNRIVFAIQQLSYRATPASKVMN